MKWAYRIVKYVVVPIAAFALVFPIADRRMIKNIDGPLPKNFPLLVITGPESDPHARVIFAGHLDTLNEIEGPVRFLVPSEQQVKFRAQIKSVPTGFVDGHFIQGCDERTGFASFDVREEGLNRQELRVRALCSDDYEDVGIYTATESGIEHAKQKFYFGPGLVMMCGPFVLGIWGAALGVFWLVERKKAGRNPVVALTT